MLKWLRRLFIIALVASAGQAGWLDAKAWLAQQLIAHAWHVTLDQGQPQRPWPWADTWPVVKLTRPDGRALYALESASGQALAFGPGRISGGPGSLQALTLAGHRDTHFAFLQHLQNGDTLTVQYSNAQQTVFQVSSAEIIDSQQHPLRIPSTPQQLILITCYPFDALRPGGSLRYVVTAHQPKQVSVAKPTAPPLHWNL